LILKKFDFDEEFINYNRQIIFSHMKYNFENNNNKEKELYKEKLKKIEELCDLTLPLCIYDSESKFKITENLILTTNENLNIIDDYCDNQDYFNNNDSFKFEISEIDSDEILIERKTHFCENIRKKLAKSLVIRNNEKKKYSNDSFISTGTEKSNENNNNYNLDSHYFKKMRYKEQRKNKYYSYKVEYNKDIDYNNMKPFETQNFDEYENFVNTINSKYKMVSLVNIYVLQENKKDTSILNHNNLEYTG